VTKYCAECMLWNTYPPIVILNMTASTEESTQVIDRSRYRHILWFFSRVIIHLVWYDLFLGRIFKSSIRQSRSERFRQLSRRFRILAVEMGGVMIKLGQFLSSRVDVLPPEITDELAGLQDEVPPVPIEGIQEVLTAELGDLTQHFSEFEIEPLAAASLGQAHRAWLLSSGRSRSTRGPSVVVKVQRPRIEDIVRTDLAALFVVARWAMRYKPIRKRADVPALMQEFATTLWEELDYETEADNAEKFAEIFTGNDDIVVPSVYREHSTRRILVLEDVSGIKITEVDEIQAAGVDTSKVAALILDVYFQQIFKEGFFHADPHPGNLFVIPYGVERRRSDDLSRPFRVSFVDFGMVGHIEELMGDNLRRVLVSVTQRDARGLTEAFNDLGFFLPGTDLDRITEAQEVILDHIWGRNLLELTRPDPQEMHELSQEFRDLLFDFPFQVPQDFVFLGRAMGMLSGLTSLLDPNINPWHLAEKYGREIISTQEALDISLNALTDWLKLFVFLPGQLNRFLIAAEGGRLRVRPIPDRTLMRQLNRIERRISRPNWSFIAAALLLSGTLLYINGETELAIISWLLAGFFLLVALLPGS
jgi:predicted unusual protein kinase regulating ubiquinone biosynthesis (AarF/ABC1/UbiB family)